jgi:segregation and condensation protein A
VAEAGARLAIRLLQDAAERGEIDPWDVDVIAVIDGFLDQLRQRLPLARQGQALLLPGSGGSYEHELAQTSEAFLAASVLVGLKAELLEAATFPPEPLREEAFAADDDGWEEGEGALPMALPRRPERHLQRRPVAPPPLQRPVTLGELIRQLEDIAERLEQQEGQARPRPRGKRFSDRAAIAQVAALAHREKLPETTAALSGFLQSWQATAAAADWVDFEQLVRAWGEEVDRRGAGDDLDRDRVGVFWALLFLSAQGRLELEQEGGLYSPLRLRGLEASGAAPLPARGGAPRSGEGPPGSAAGADRPLLAA